MSQHAPDPRQDELRHRAEVQLGRMISKTVPSLAPENVEALVHELRVHQIELQLQNHELQRTQQEAEDSRDRYHDLFESAPVAYCTLSEDRRIQEMNEAAEALLAVDRKTAVGKPFTAFVSNDHVPRFDRACRAMLDTPGRHECELALKAGSIIKTVLIDGCTVGDGEAKERLRIALTEITEHKQAEERLIQQEVELREQHTELQALNARLFFMEEDVRKRVAEELHEGFSQRIRLITISLSALQATEPSSTSTTWHKIADIKHQLSRLAVDIQHLSHNLRSRFLEYSALPTAIKDYIEELNMYARPKVQFEAGTLPDFCQPDLALVLFRVMQEALHNISRHAEAREAWVDLNVSGNHLVLTVRDRGKGFDPRDTKTFTKGFGLLCMRERLRAVNGRLKIDARLGHGTTITASVPVAPAA